MTVQSTPRVKAMERLIGVKLRAAERFIAEVIEPLADIGSPEKVMGKKYEDWTAEDVQRLAAVYGTGNDSALAKLIFRKTLKEVNDLEAEAGK